MEKKQDVNILKQLGYYFKPLKKTRHNLKEYFVDGHGNIWTKNRHTYVTKYGKWARKSTGKDAVVTLRDDFGKKVSILRSKLVRAYHTNTTSNF